MDEKPTCQCIICHYVNHEIISIQEQALPSTNKVPYDTYEITKLHMEKDIY